MLGTHEVSPLNQPPPAPHTMTHQCVKMKKEVQANLPVQGMVDGVKDVAESASYPQATLLHNAQIYVYCWL